MHPDCLGIGIGGTLYRRLLCLSLVHSQVTTHRRASCLLRASAYPTYPSREDVAGCRVVARHESVPAAALEHPSFSASLGVYVFGGVRGERNLGAICMQLLQPISSSAYKLNARNVAVVREVSSQASPSDRFLG